MSLTEKAVSNYLKRHGYTLDPLIRAGEYFVLDRDWNPLYNGTLEEIAEFYGLVDKCKFSKTDKRKIRECARAYKIGETEMASILVGIGRVKPLAS
jgi:hypothetical protein